MNLRSLLANTILMGLIMTTAKSEDQWVSYQGADGPGKGKKVVLVSGDEEYRSEELCSQLGKILSKYHGFNCTVLFAVDPKTGEIDTVVNNNIPGLEALKDADLMVIFTRWRNLPPEQMKYIDEYTNSGKPIIGIRTATHAFKFPADHPYVKWDYASKVAGFEQGFGRQVLGETWINHHGKHGTESQRGVVAPGQEKNPIVRGCEDIWGPTDVYQVRLPLPGDSVPVIMGQVLTGMQPTDKPLEGAKNNPMMPIAWTKSFTGSEGKKARVFTTTLGCAKDFESEGFRRLLVNACYWAVGLEEKIPEKAKVDIIGEYQALPMGFAKHRKGVKPSAHAMP
ncbi:MAG TPA: ThuA domain-containing protein [Planctomycetota bacterium]|jgi:type 1 glutamine amidotransferase